MKQGTPLLALLPRADSFSTLPLSSHGTSADRFSRGAQVRRRPLLQEAALGVFRRSILPRSSGFFKIRGLGTGREQQEIQIQLGGSEWT